MLGGIEKPDAGTLERAQHLQVVTFDQHRSRLNPKASLRRTLAPHGDAVIHQGRSVHVVGWAKRFLFRAEQLDTPVGRLSGGEQARALIAGLMLEPADLLLLDEPTNDLDIPTLEALEESLLEFSGALVLVTHDRYLLDRVSTQLLALDGQGGATFYADYAQWEQGQRAAAEKATLESGSARPKASATRAAAEKPKKLGYLEQREWNQMEALIMKAEQRLESSQQAAADPGVVSDPKALRQRLAAMAEAQADVDRLYARWAELEGKVTV
jgi:ATP-binding cassette subfamily F protein uup